MSDWLDKFCRCIEVMMASLMAAMVVLVFGNVVLRYGFNSGITVSEELSRWIFVWMIFLGAIVGIKEHAHLGTDVLVSRLGSTGKRACLVISQLAMLYVTWLIFSGSLAQSRISYDVQAPASGLSMAWVSGVGVLFALLSAPLLLRELWRVLSGRASEADLVMVQDGEGLMVVRAVPAHSGQSGPDGSNKG